MNDYFPLERRSMASFEQWIENHWMLDTIRFVNNQTYYRGEQFAQNSDRKVCDSLLIHYVLLLFLHYVLLVWRFHCFVFSYCSHGLCFAREIIFKLISPPRFEFVEDAIPLNIQTTDVHVYFDSGFLIRKLAPIFVETVRCCMLSKISIYFNSS